MYSEILNMLTSNLIDVGFALLIFCFAYLSNMALSIYHNVSQLKQAFDKNKIIDSVIKIIFVCVGIALLVVAITALPVFANTVGWIIPDEYSSVFSDFVILSACLYMSCKYILEAVKEFMSIMNYKQTESTNNAVSDSTENKT